MKSKLEYPIVSPKIFGEKPIGSTAADKPAKFIGRNVTIYGKAIEKNFPKQYYKFTFKIEKLEDNVLKTGFVGHEVSRAYMSKNVRVGSTRIDSVVKEISEDGYAVTLKPIVITSKNICSSIAAKLRKELSKFLKLYIQKNTLEAITKEIMSDELQGYLKKSLNAIYPINILEIRKSEVRKFKVKDTGVKA
jgi:ribosomal protein S3AE